jgi:ABC-type tungstate transport system permease subunit
MNYRYPHQIKDWLIEDQEYNKINKLKKNNLKLFTIGLKAV